MKKLLTIALNICAIALLVSCKGKEQKEATKEFTPSLDGDTSCEITVVGSYDNFEALDAEIKVFNRFYPKVYIEYEKIDDYNNKLGTVLERENKPNIFFSYTWMMGNDKYSNVISHMEDLSDKKLNINLECIRPGLINRDVEGKTLMVPVFSRTYGALINNDLFKKEGLAVPTTWNELLSVSDSFKSKGYKSPMMGYTKGSSSSLMNTIAYPAFVAELAKNPDALAKANNLDPSAGAYMNGALSKVKELIDNGVFDIEECNKIEDNYNKTILRFFEGDVPMMVCGGDAPSGTKKRESQSPAFVESPFDYSFLPIPLTDQGGYFIDSPSIEFSVNKDCENLDMTNEFMRFLINKAELNNMASIKRLVTPTTDLSFDPYYAQFGQIPADRTYSPEALGIKDALTVQLRIASYKVGKGELTIEEAMSQYGSLSE